MNWTRQDVDVAWLLGFSPDDGPPEPDCERCNDVGRIPVVLHEDPEFYFSEWTFIDCPCQTKT